MGQDVDHPVGRVDIDVGRIAEDALHFERDIGDVRVARVQDFNEQDGGKTVGRIRPGRRREPRRSIDPGSVADVERDEVSRVRDVVEVGDARLVDPRLPAAVDLALAEGNGELVAVPRRPVRPMNRAVDVMLLPVPDGAVAPVAPPMMQTKMLPFEKTVSPTP
jgi:hypothetical protein